MSLWRSVWLQILAIVILALAVRVAAFTVALHRVDFYHGAWDYHTEIGRNVMKGRWLEFRGDVFIAYSELSRNHPNGWVNFNKLEVKSNEDSLSISHIDFGYGVLAGLIWKCLGRIDWGFIILLQIAIDSLMCIPLYFIGQNIGSKKKGLLAALLFALFPLEIKSAITPSYDIWVSFFYISAVYLLLLEQKQEKKWSSLAIVAGIGVLNAYTAWIRSTVVLFPVIIAMYLLLDPREKFQWVKAASLILVFSFMYIIPKVAHTYNDSGEFRITRGTVWFSFYAGLGQFKNDFGIDPTDTAILKYCIEKSPELADKPYVYNWQRYEEILEPRVKEIIRENPLWYTGTVLKRAGVILFPSFYYNSGGASRYITSSILICLRILLVAWSLLFLFGSYIGLRKRFDKYVVILLPYLYTLATISPFFLQGRLLTSIYFIQFFGVLEALWYLYNILHRRFRSETLEG